MNPYFLPVLPVYYGVSIGLKHGPVERREGEVPRQCNLISMEINLFICYFVTQSDPQGFKGDKETHNN